MLFPDTPFQSLALALSGGGFRAAAYGLGVLSLLDQLKIPEEKDTEKALLEKVHFISSASGGTITLSVYAACKSAGMSFNEFYAHLYARLKADHLLDKVFEVLDKDEHWKSGPDNGKYRNPINAFSLVYHEYLFDGIPNEFGKLRTPDNDSHVKEVCFNSSEFTTGLSFRFQCHQQPANPGARGGDFGSDGAEPVNNESWKALDRLRLADILASSSCFPGGFEPMRYPHDFAHTELSVASLESALRIQPNVGKPTNRLALMDGGICDNQGLDSLLNAFKRKPLLANRTNPNKDAFDLLLVCDVASHFMRPAEFNEPNLPPKIKNRTPDSFWAVLHGWWKKIPNWLNWIRLISFAILLYSIYYNWQYGMQTPATVLGLLCLAVGGFAWWGIKELKKIKQHSGSKLSLLNQPTLENIVLRLLPKGGFAVTLGNKLMNYIRKRPVSELAHWVNDRVSSGTTLVGDIFLKQIRRQIYYKLYADLQTFYRRVYIPIYSLSTTNKGDKFPPFDIRGEEPDETYNPRLERYRAQLQEFNTTTDAMKKVADLAYSMGTTLWFSPEEEGAEYVANTRVALIACGQFTTAYELLQYALLLQESRYFTTLSPHYQNVVRRVVDQLKTQLQKFRKDPYWLVKELNASIP